MGDAGAAGIDLGAMEEAAIREEDAEARGALDHETVGLAGLGTRMFQHQQAGFLEPQGRAVGGEAGRAAQVRSLMDLEVPNAADEDPLAAEEGS
jgi:hypothetical protein